MRPDPLWRGIEPHGSGYLATVSCGTGRRLRRTFPKGTDPRVMQRWRQDTKAKHRLSPRGPSGTFAGDAARYLQAVRGMPTYAQRKRDIGLWTAVFGTRAREDITATDIRIQREVWAQAPRSAADPRPVSGATINKRLRALSNLWTVLDGPRAPNPVRDVPEYPERADVARALDYATIEAILSHVPDRGRPVKGQTRPTASQTKARLRVLAYTGWPSGVLAQLTPADVDLTAGTARLPARQKGAGAPPALVPLLPQAVTALQAFDALGCWGAFSRHSLRKTWARAATKAGVTGTRPYDLRHSFGVLAASSGDERATQHLLQHRDLRTTQRYTLGGIQPRVVSAITAAAKRLKRR